MLAKVLGFKGVRNLGILQFATADQDTLKYISSSAAIKGGFLEILEVSEAGSVNELIVLNKSGMFVFLMDGDILVGAKQNRVVNTSILLAPNTKTRIPVSCVERGRWKFVSDKFAPTDYSAPLFLRAEKAAHVKQSLSRARGFAADQGEIWRGVDERHRDHGVLSETASLSDLYDQKKDSFEEFVQQFTQSLEANGMAVFFSKELLSVDIFNRKEIFAEYFPKLLRGVAIETFSMKAKKNAVAEGEAKYRTLEFLDGLESVPGEEFPGVGVGMERRFDTPGMTGFELRFQSLLVHATVLRLSGGAAW
jgi:hypothetical protein